MVSAGSYILSALALAALVLSLGFSAVRLRRRLLPEWEGAPAHLVESVLAVALLIWLAELLGLVGLLYAWTLPPASLLLAGAAFWLVDLPPEGGTERSDTPPSVTQGQALMSLIALGVVAVVFAHWGLTTKDALDRGIFNFDSLWYHMPFAVDMAQSHSVTGLHYTETVFTNWLYPQNSELLHAVGILFSERDTLSLFLNFGWLGFAFLAAWCIGRPYGRGPLSVVAVAVILECHTLVVREPGAAKNDLMAAALLLAAIAILINAWAAQKANAPRVETEEDLSASSDAKGAAAAPVGQGKGRLPLGWALAAAGLAVGLAVGTKSTTLAMAAGLTLAVLVLAPAGRRWAAAGWWFLPAFAGAGFWYLRNLIVAGNPLPQIESLGPISLPHPERLQTGRPDFSIVHYATDIAIWREYFGPGLDQAFGTLWPVVIGGAVAGALLALLHNQRIIRWSGAVALLGLLAYLFTPLSAAGAEGDPVGFGINIRYAIPALLAGAALLPLGIAALQSRRPGSAPAGHAAGHERGLLHHFSAHRGEWVLLAVLLAVMAATNRSDAVLRDPDRLFGLLIAVLAVVVPAALLLAWQRARSPRGSAGPRAAPGESTGLTARSHRGGVGPTIYPLIGLALLAIVVGCIGYAVQRDYLRDRFRPGADIPGMHLDSAYAWARGVSDARIGLAGTTAGFLQYGFYGGDLSNEVRYLGQKGSHGAFNAIPACRAFRAAVNSAGLDYLVTSPFLNFIHPDQPVPSPEATWLRGEADVKPLDRSGPVTVWEVRGPLDPAACGPANAPLRQIPQTPGL